MKKTVISFILTASLSVSAFSQTGTGSRAAKTADTVMKAPVETIRQMLDELSSLRQAVLFYPRPSAVQLMDELNRSGDSSGDYFERAVNSYIAKVSISKETPEQKLLLLRKALETAKTPSIKRSVLQQMARTDTFIGLVTAGKYLDDADGSVRQAAAQAVCTIASDHPEYDGAEITALLNKAVAVDRDQGEAVQNHPLPKDEGFVSMFNGKDLTGWKGLVEDPVKRGRMTPEELAGRQKKADEIMRRDWHAADGILVFDGPAYDNLCSEKMYGDFEMYVDWKIAAKGDAGIYLRGSPQVQIWDVPETGSGYRYWTAKRMYMPTWPLISITDRYTDLFLPGGAI